MMIVNINQILKLSVIEFNNLSGHEKYYACKSKLIMKRFFDKVKYCKLSDRKIYNFFIQKII